MIVELNVMASNGTTKQSTKNSTIGLVEWDKQYIGRLLDVNCIVVLSVCLREKISASALIGMDRTDADFRWDVTSWRVRNPRVDALLGTYLSPTTVTF